MILFVLEVLHSHVVELFLYSQSVVLHHVRQGVNCTKDSNIYGVTPALSIFLTKLLFWIK